MKVEINSKIQIKIPKSDDIVEVYDLTVEEAENLYEQLAKVLNKPIEKGDVIYIEYPQTIKYPPLKPYYDPNPYIYCGSTECNDTNYETTIRY